jgi:hypothetical protein
MTNLENPLNKRNDHQEYTSLNVEKHTSILSTTEIQMARKTEERE